jgi:VanZ family protein
LYPYGILTANGVYPMEFESGAYFDGLGIAFTPGRLDELPDGPLTELTAELWVHERPTSRNFGPRALFSISDGHHFVPFQLGQWASRLYAYSPRHDRATPWWTQWIMKERLPRGRDHTVALSWGPGERSIYLNGRLELHETITPERPLGLSGRLVLGNSPSGRQGWWGEIQGFALYRTALSAEQIDDHYAIARRSSVAYLATQPDIVALFDLPPSEYPRVRNASRNLVPGLGDLRFPPRFTARIESIARFPDFEEIARYGLFRDLAQNLALFLPFGWLGIAVRWNGSAKSRRRAWLVTVALGAAFSGGMELVQLTLPTRSAAITDILLNTLGTALGAVAYLTSRVARERSSRRNISATAAVMFTSTNAQNARR